MPETTQLTLPVLPLHNGVVFPHMAVTIQVSTDEGRIALEAAEKSGGRILLVPRLQGRFASVGTVARIQGDEDGNIVVSGESRARVGAGSVDENGALWVEAEESPDVDISDESLDELVAEYRAVVSAVLENRGMSRVAERLLAMDNPSQLADLAVYSPDLSLEQKVELLEALDIRHRLGLLIEWMREVLADQELRRKVRDDASERIEKSQKDYILRQQLEAIKKELGEEGDVSSEYQEKLETLRTKEAPEQVIAAIEKEIDRLERMSEQSPEHSWIRTWLDTMFDLPWGTLSNDRLELDEAWTVLDADHTGLHDVKERIVEHLAVRKLRKERVSPTTRRATAERFSSSSARPAWARPPWVSRWRAPSVASSSGSLWAGSATRPRSGATAAPTSVPGPVASPAPSPRPAP